MANDSITTVLSIVAWGTNLTFGLYDFSVANAFAPATEDVNKLAKEVNLLSQVLRQIGSRLKEDETLPSPDAFNTVRQILNQCQVVFTEIESLIPLGPSRQNSQDESPQMSVANYSPWREELDWNALSQARTQYLLAHLESLKLTLSVMLQTLYTAKTTIWAKYDDTQTGYDAVVVERLQTESLVIEQQLALIRSYRLYDTFTNQVRNAPLRLSQNPLSQALIKRDENGPKPSALVLYQEPTLAQRQPSINEAEDLSQVRMISSPFVDQLLSRWTRMHVIEKQLQIDQRPRQERRRELAERRNWQAPYMESDPESEMKDRKRPSRLHLTTEDPILMHVNEPRANMSSPMSAAPRSGASLQPPGGPFSPQPSHSWGPTSGGYFPQTSRDGARPRGSPGPSPCTSPRVSFSSTGEPQRPQTAFKAEQSESRSQAPPPRQPVRWRLRINQWCWDYHDDEQIQSNTNMPPEKAIKTVSRDTNAITEVFQEHVSREAIRDRGYEYTKVERDCTIDGRPAKELIYCIDRALRYDQVLRLVDFTERIRNPDTTLPSSPHSPRSPRTSRGGPVLPPPPPLDHSNTAPVYGNKFRDTHPRQDSYYSTNSRSNTSDSNASDENNKQSLSKSRRRDSDTYDGSSRTRGEKDRDRDRERERERERSKSKGSTRGATLTKIAAGAGLATLLDGLPEMLSYL